MSLAAGRHNILSVGRSWGKTGSGSKETCLTQVRGIDWPDPTSSREPPYDPRHTGPVFEGYDAVIGRNNYFGSHVSRAARIEPVTAPGCAFASEQFAAALALTPGHGFVCEYLGMQPLAKDYDVCPLYRLTTGADGAL